MNRTRWAPTCSYPGDRAAVWARARGGCPGYMADGVWRQVGLDQGTPGSGQQAGSGAILGEGMLGGSGRYAMVDSADTWTSLAMALDKLHQGPSWVSLSYLPTCLCI